MTLLFTLLRYTPVVCTLCLTSVFLIYDMRQVGLSLDRVDVQNSVERITAGLALTEKIIAGMEKCLAPFLSWIPDENSGGRCYPSWLGNSTPSETAHKIGFVHPQETSCALDVK